MYYVEILRNLYKAQEERKPVVIRYRDQILRGVITIVQCKGKSDFKDYFEIKTDYGYIEGLIKDITEIRENCV